MLTKDEFLAVIQMSRAVGQYRFGHHRDHEPGAALEGQDPEQHCSLTEVDGNVSPVAHYDYIRDPSTGEMLPRLIEVDLAHS